MALKLYAGPASEPVSLPEAKLHLRVETSDDDDLIRGLIVTARTNIETLSLHQLITQTWDWVMDAFPGASVIELPLAPLQSVTGIYYTPYGGSELTFAATNYLVDTYSIPGRIVLKRDKSWPGDDLVDANGVKIRFVAGFGEAAAVDIRAVQAMKLLIGHYYENREAVFMGRTTPDLLPQGVTALCYDLRMRMKRF